ncbi:MAG: FprA family A-type flavoprotein [Lachnospiraceae bacterium]|nr:FprA family A-type flavoprotein [Lachnospiraceae bacterium]
MSVVEISGNIRYVGVEDRDIDLFESQYVVPEGVTYNSYLILDEKTALMDTVDARKTKEWLENLKKELNGRTPDYLVISHLEPDHAGSIAAVVEEYPQMKLVGNARTFSMFPQFFDINIEDKKVIVAEGQELSLGSHTLQFFMAPMVHWPEVMVTYEQKEKVLFSADGFGRFGMPEDDGDWACEARRYYFNIVGKYGAQVQALLKKAAALDIEKICPLHGPVLDENLKYYIDKYDVWSSYTPEDKGVLIAYASIHGNTAKAVEELAQMLKEKGEEKVVVSDLAREDMAEVIEDAFRYDRIVLASPTYDGGLFPCMENFLMHLKSKGFQKRTAALMENGSWAPMAAKQMRQMLEDMKDITILEPVVSIRSSVNDKNREEMETLAAEITSEKKE